MNYSTQELTEQLQQLVNRARQAAVPSPQLPDPLNVMDFQPSPEIETFLRERADYVNKTRGVNVGIY
jgi:hypothetical protein